MPTARKFSFPPGADISRVSEFDPLRTLASPSILLALGRHTMRPALTFFVLLSALASIAAAQGARTCGVLAPGWAATRSDRARAVNSLAIDGSQDKPTWNGAPVTPDDVREYLNLTSQMSPQPVFVLVVGPHADCSEVAVYRRMATDILKCGNGLCVEINP